MNAVDTNVLIYAHDPRDEIKRRKALDPVASLDDGVLIWQVVCEFLASSRKLEAVGYRRQEAWATVHRLRQAWSVVYPGWETLERAQKLLEEFSLSFWDAMILAACATTGVERFYTEDFDAYSVIAGVEVVNPFRSL